MSCKYCKTKHMTKSGIGHGEDMVVHDGVESCEPISASIWNDAVLNIETSVDNLYAAIKINYCPKCGEKLESEN